MSIAHKIITWLDPFYELEYGFSRPKDLNETINLEAEMAATIFGPIPQNHKRQFFNYKKNLWIWHEEWLNGDSMQSMTVRYLVRKNGVFKKIEGTKLGYIQLRGAELENFRKATHAYLNIIKNRIYSYL